MLEGAWSACCLPAVCPIQDTMDGPSSGYHVHSSLQRLAPHVNMRSLKGTTGRPVKLARAERALGVRRQRPCSGPDKRRNTTVASPAQLSGVATGIKLVGFKRQLLTRATHSVHQLADVDHSGRPRTPVTAPLLVSAHQKPFALDNSRRIEQSFDAQLYMCVAHMRSLDTTYNH
jgi:hypothetical protein